MRHIPAATRDGLLKHPLLPPDDRSQIALFVDCCEAYADLERRILGELSYDLPVHQVTISGGATGRIRREARELAESTRALLELSPPGLGFPHATEMHAARLFSMPLSQTILGVFVFAGEIGPSFLVNSRLSSGADRFALAHLYCHYLADSDPYRPEVCLSPESRTGTPGWSELRADSFADELFMPEDLLRPFVESEAGTSDEGITIIASYLELPHSLVRRRLDGLGHQVMPADSSDRWQGGREVVFPERLVRLALEGIHTDRLDVDEFARALNLSRSDAIELLRLSSAPPSA